jgi:hypothetical protein
MRINSLRNQVEKILLLVFSTWFSSANFRVRIYTLAFIEKDTKFVSNFKKPNKVLNLLFSSYIIIIGRAGGADIILGFKS